MILPEHIRPFDKECLQSLVRADHHDKAVIAKINTRIDHIVKHLRPWNATTIVIEPTYIDHDYLDDFASYYSTCFSPPDRLCQRVHFFGPGFSVERFRESVRACNEDAKATLPCDYLGFVVLRPLLHAPIGRAILVPPIARKSERAEFSKRFYHPNLFGVDFVLEGLAFQEQDGVLSSCAATALWSCFQQSEVIFGTPKVTTADINRALNPIPHSGLSVPMGPLDIVQMANVFRRFGLEAHVLPVGTDLPLLAMVYSYVSFGMPVVLAVQAQGVKHALPVVGFSIPHAPSADHDNPPLRGNRVSALYIHDDLSGPYSRLKPPQADDSIASPRRRRRVVMSGDGANRYELQKIIIPSHHKIRLPFATAHQWVIRAHEYFRFSFQRRPEFAAHFEWDLKLQFSNQYKKNLRMMRLADGPQVEETVCQSHPKYIWQARLAQAGTPLLDVLLDATALPDAFPIYQLVWLAPGFKELVGKPVADKELGAKARQFLGTELSKLFI
jgi:hypothetical protein